jgi:ABC-type sugar transport system permease subunit
MMIIPSLWVLVVCVILPFIHMFYLAREAAQKRKNKQTAKVAAASSPTNSNPPSANKDD